MVRKYAAPLLGAVLFAAGAAGAAGNFVQHGFLWTPEKLNPDMNRVSPMKGFERLFGVDGLVAFLKTLLKVAAVGLTFASGVSYFGSPMAPNKTASVFKHRLSV